GQLAAGEPRLEQVAGPEHAPQERRVGVLGRVEAYIVEGALLEERTAADRLGQVDVPQGASAVRTVDDLLAVPIRTGERLVLVRRLFLRPLALRPAVDPRLVRCPHPFPLPSHSVLAQTPPSRTRRMGVIGQNATWVGWAVRHLG